MNPQFVSWDCYNHIGSPTRRAVAFSAPGKGCLFGLALVHVHGQVCTYTCLHDVNVVGVRACLQTCLTANTLMQHPASTLHTRNALVECLCLGFYQAQAATALLQLSNHPLEQNRTNVPLQIRQLTQSKLEDQPDHFRPMQEA